MMQGAYMHSSSYMQWLCADDTIIRLHGEDVCGDDRPANISGGLQVRVGCDFALARLPLGVVVVVAQHDVECVHCGICNL